MQPALMAHLNVDYHPPSIYAMPRGWDVGRFRVDAALKKVRTTTLSL